MLGLRQLERVLTRVRATGAAPAMLGLWQSGFTFCSHQGLCYRGSARHVGLAHAVDEQGQGQGQAQKLSWQGQNHGA